MDILETKLQGMQAAIEIWLHSCALKIEQVYSHFVLSLN